MNLSKKAEYAVRAMVILAAQNPGASMQAQDMSRAGDVPLKFLEQILLALRRGGLVVSKRGVGGGYRIGREPRLISVAEVVQCIEGEPAPLAELPSSGFPGATGIIDCFSRAAQVYWAILEKTNLEDLLHHQSGENMMGFGI